jgi:quinol-cytochrome oxidoreductase complex cytochrome b subunit
MPLPTLFGAKYSARWRVWLMGLGWFIGFAGILIFDRFVSHDGIRFARDAAHGIMLFVIFVFLYAFLTILDKDKSGNELSLTNTGSGSEAQTRVNRSSPEVKEQ